MWEHFFLRNTSRYEIVSSNRTKSGVGGRPLFLGETTRGGGVTDRRHQKLKASGKVDAVPRPCRERVGCSNLLGSCRFLFHLVSAIVIIAVRVPAAGISAANLLFWITDLLRFRLVEDRTFERTNLV